MNYIETFFKWLAILAFPLALIIQYFNNQEKKNKSKNLDCSILRKIRAKWSYARHPYYQSKGNLYDEYCMMNDVDKTAHFSYLRHEQLVSNLIKETVKDSVWRIYHDRHNYRKHLYIQKTIYKDFKNML